MNLLAKEFEFPGIKRLFIISDTHLGVRANSTEWMEIQKDFFFEWFIPLLEKNYRPGDALIHAGDVFDSRQSINLKVLNLGLEIFERISKIMPVYVICGNHDVYHKKTNEINSLKPLKFIPNIHVFEEPAILKLNENKISVLLMPWCESKEIEQEIINLNRADYLFCHTDIRGLKFNSFSDVLEGNYADVFKDFKGVYSGHIHYAQKFKNIRMVGCPYQMTRGDINNDKHIWLLDLETGEEQGFLNDFSPKFLKIKLDYLLELTYEKAKKLFENNFVDILVDSVKSANFPFNSFLELFSDVRYRRINYLFTLENENEIPEYGDNLHLEGETDILKLINLYIENLAYKESIKQKLLNISSKIYFKVLKENEEETLG